MGSLYGLEGPSFLKEVFQLCAEHRLNFRLPKSTKTFGPVPEELKNVLAEIVQIAENLGIGLLDNLCTHPFPLTKDDSYQSVKDYYLNLIRNLPAGITEMYLHPAKETEELKAVCPDWQKRVWEYQLLLDDEVIRTIEAEGIKVVSWADAPFKNK